MNSMRSRFLFALQSLRGAARKHFFLTLHAFATRSPLRPNNLPHSSRHSCHLPHVSSPQKTRTNVKTRSSLHRVVEALFAEISQMRLASSLHHERDCGCLLSYHLRFRLQGLTFPLLLGAGVPFPGDVSGISTVLLGAGVPFTPPNPRKRRILGCFSSVDSMIAPASGVCWK